MEIDINDNTCKVVKEVNIKPFAYAFSLINGKWKMYILFWLWRKEIMRYNELKKSLGNVSHKVFSAQLKELEQDGVITRTVYDDIPPKVEYRLSNFGNSMMPFLQALCKWGVENMPEAWEQ